MSLAGVLGQIWLAAQSVLDGTMSKLTGFNHFWRSRSVIGLRVAHNVDNVRLERHLKIHAGSQVGAGVGNCPRGWPPKGCGNLLRCALEHPQLPGGEGPDVPGVKKIFLGVLVGSQGDHLQEPGLSDVLDASCDRLQVRQTEMMADQREGWLPTDAAKSTTPAQNSGGSGENQPIIRVSSSTTRRISRNINPSLALSRARIVNTAPSPIEVRIT